MKPFQFVEAASLEDASEMLATAPNRAMVIAGGTDIMGEIKERVVTPETLVSLLNVSDLRGIDTDSSGGLRIGAMTTLAEIEGYSSVAERYPALAQAVASVATPQIRNVGTLGGNLCQRPRCWYYRSPMFDCRKKGGTICFAVEGSSKYHAILGGVDCYIVHPSDVAVALMSLNAQVEIQGRDGTRNLPIEDFFIGPATNIMAENVLQPGELLTSVTLPPVSPNQRSIYLKTRERQAQDFALVSVAVYLEVSDDIIDRARIILGGVAPIPWRCSAAERALSGRQASGVDMRLVGQLAVANSQPLRDNHFKARLAESLVTKALTALLDLRQPN